MTSHHEPDGTLVVAYDGRVWTRLMSAIGSVFVLTLAYDLTLGTRGTDRAIALVGASATCFLIALVALEVGSYSFDPGSGTISWRWRWAWSRRAGSMPFDEVQAVLVETPIGDEGTPSRRIVLRLADGKEMPLTAGYKPDADDSILGIAGQIRTIVGLVVRGEGADAARAAAAGPDRRAASPGGKAGRTESIGTGRTESAAGLDHVEALIRAGHTMDAVKLLRRTTGCSLTEAMRQIDDIKCELLPG